METLVSVPLIHNRNRKVILRDISDNDEFSGFDLQAILDAENNDLMQGIQQDEVEAENRRITLGGQDPNDGTIFETVAEYRAAVNTLDVIEPLSNFERRLYDDMRDIIGDMEEQQHSSYRWTTDTLIYDEVVIQYGNDPLAG